MKKIKLKPPAVLAAVMALILMLGACSDNNTEEPVRDGTAIAGELVTELPDSTDEIEGYAENMRIFGDVIKNMYTYECVYQYYVSGNRNTAFDAAEILKTKLFYAMRHGYFLTEDEQVLVRSNAESYLRMQYDTLGMSDEYSSDSVAGRLFGINAEQYTMIRLCESLAEKCESDMKESYESENPVSEDDIKDYYASHRDEFDFVLIRYISYKLDTSGNGSVNKDITERAERFLNTVETVNDILDVIGGESDMQTEGDSNGQETVYMNDTDNIFCEFARGEGRELNAKTLVYDSENVYAAVTEGYFTYDTSEDVAGSVKEAYIQDKVASEMTENMLEYDGVEDWYVMSDSELINAAVLRDDYTGVVAELKIADSASSLFITVQDPGDVTSCRFYAYKKNGGEWVQAFKTSGYVGRSGVEDTENRIEGNGTSPAGLYGFGMLFGIKDDPGGLLKEYTKVDNDDYWDGDKNSDTYNMHVRGSEMPPSWNRSASEHLIDYTYSYNYAAMVNFNVDPAVKGKGSAIFLHCTSPGSLASSGCISIPESKMLSALRMIDEDSYILIVRNPSDIAEYCRK